MTPLGTGVQASWEKLVSLKSGVRALTADDLKQSDNELLQRLPSQVAAPVTRGSGPGEFDYDKWQVSEPPPASSVASFADAYEKEMEQF